MTNKPLDTLFSTTPKDEIFRNKQAQINDFAFDQNVSRVFPDMIKRSVPGYTTIVENIGNLAPLFAQDSTILYDLGCSLGAVSMNLRRTVKAQNCKIVALDNSSAMIERAKIFLNAQEMMHEDLLEIDLQEADITQYDYQPSSLITLNFTLQFIAPEQRLPLLQKLRSSLVSGGALFLSEKIMFDDEQENQRINDFHITFKKANDYSDLEIAQKRQALENVMKIESITAHQARLKAAGFKESYVWFQCLNFVSMIAIA